VIDGYVERRLTQHWRSRNSRQKLPYVHIDDELREQTSWPPPSQLGNSLVDIMRLENSYFQAEQAEEMLLPKSASGDTVASDVRPQAEPVVADSFVWKTESCFVATDALAEVENGEPRPYDGTVL